MKMELYFQWLKTKEIELWRDDFGPGVEWFCDLITVLDLDAGHGIPFPVQRTITPSTRYRIRTFDTCLPQDDPYPEQRQKELELKRTVYLPNPLLPFVSSETRCFNIEEVKLFKDSYISTEHFKCIFKLHVYKIPNIILSLCRIICFQISKNIPNRLRYFSVRILITCLFLKLFAILK